MATPGKHSFSLQRGSSASRIFRAKQTDGTLVDLTGWSVRMQIRSSDGATGTSTTTTLILDLTNGNGIAITDAVNGEITLTLTPANTTTLAPENVRTRLSYGVELYRSAPTADVLPLLQGTITVLPEVVRE